MSIKDRIERLGSTLRVKGKDLE